MAASMDEDITANPPPSSEEDPLAEERLGFVREVGAQAVWSLSSCKPGNFWCNYVILTYSTIFFGLQDLV